MASLSNDSGGRKRLLFMAADGRRKAIRLGAVTKKAAEEVRGHVETLVEATITHRALPDETSRWIDALPEVWRRRFERAGLVAPKAAPAPAPEPEPAGPTLGDFLAGYMGKRVDLKESTRVALGQTVRYLVEHFGADKPLDTITPGDADAFRRALAARLGANTVNRRCGTAKQFFRAAVRRRLLTENPFQDLVGGVRANPAREYFITRAEAAKVLDACPTAEWRLLVALCRFGGLRCPSEVLALTWDGVLWDKGRIVVPSPKTEHIPGHESRVIPLFPELEPYLREAFEQAAPGTVHVIARYRTQGINLRMVFATIIRRAGLTPWPKLFQNLRATRETELADTFPMHVVCAWMGNSQLVALRHYLQVTDAHFEKAAQKAAQSGAVSLGTVRESSAADVQESPELPKGTASYSAVHRNGKSDTDLNDHHFHYGYFIKAAAEVARCDPAWAADARWGAMVKLLVRDIASPDRADPQFPFLRCFDPYAGHSWASGSAKFGDGNNQESSSEAMNAWTALILWGEATRDRAIRDLGIYLYTTEMEAIDAYWFDVRGDSARPGYAASVITMVWGGKGANGTWFSANPEAVHGINWLPIQGGSLYLGRYPEYVKKNYDALVREKGGAKWDMWPDIIWMYRALDDPGDAAAQFDAGERGLRPEAGNSKANAYHWIAGLGALGHVDRTVTADVPLYAVFRKGTERAYVVYHMGDRPLAATFSDGTRLRAERKGFAMVRRPADAPPAAKGNPS